MSNLLRFYNLNLRELEVQIWKVFLLNKENN